MNIDIDEQTEFLLYDYAYNPISYNNFVQYVQSCSDYEQWYDNTNYTYDRIMSELSKHYATLIELEKDIYKVKFKSPKHKTQFVLRYS